MDLIRKDRDLDVVGKCRRRSRGGSYHWRVRETFEAKALEAAGEGAYVTIRDTSCRLFGYHGLVCGETSFSLDRMFGF